jgi:hypothetical protein
MQKFCKYECFAVDAWQDSWQGSANKRYFARSGKDGASLRATLVEQDAQYRGTKDPTAVSHATGN